MVGAAGRIAGKKPRVKAKCDSRGLAFNQEKGGVNPFVQNVALKDANPLDFEDIRLAVESITAQSRGSESRAPPNDPEQQIHLTADEIRKYRRDARRWNKKQREQAREEMDRAKEAMKKRSKSSRDSEIFKTAKSGGGDDSQYQNPKDIRLTQEQIEHLSLGDRAPTICLPYPADGICDFNIVAAALWIVLAVFFAKVIQTVVLRTHRKSSSSASPKGSDNKADEKVNKNSHLHLNENSTLTKRIKKKHDAVAG